MPQKVKLSTTLKEISNFGLSKSVEIPSVHHNVQKQERAKLS